METRDCICFNLRRAVRTVSRVYDQALSPLGLKNTQFSVLAVLIQLGPTPVSSLAEAMAMQRTTLTRNLRPLERDGYLEQVPGEDRRQRIVGLTASGRALFAKARQRWSRANLAVQKQLGEARATRMLKDARAATALVE